MIINFENLKLLCTFCLSSIKQDGENREKWIEVIDQHQEFSHYIADFQLCELHFDETQIMLNKKNEQCFKPNPIPNIFPQNPNETEAISIVELNANYCANNCVEWQIKFDKIERKLEAMERRLDEKSRKLSEILRSKGNGGAIFRNVITITASYTRAC